MKILILFIALIALSACQYDSNVDTQEKNNIIIAESFYTEPECNPFINLDSLEIKTKNSMVDLMQEVH